jgi:protein-S-isoprenylcysteine O-methyltransferase Ste14
MSKLLNACMPWLHWKVAVGVVCLLVVIGFYTDLVGGPTWIAATPLLAIAACLLPCLIPLAFLWRNDSNGAATPTTELDKSN